MGWSFSMNRAETRAQYIERNLGYSPGYELLQRRIVGNHVWDLVRKPDGKKFICLTLLSRGNGRYGKGCSDHGWGHKGISEDMGPVEVDCPLALLDAADPPEGEYAGSWREEVRKFHERKKQRPKPAEGVVVEYGGRQYRLERPAGPRKGWYCTGVQDGCQYRMRAHQLSQAQVVA